MLPDGSTVAAPSSLKAKLELQRSQELLQVGNTSAALWAMVAMLRLDRDATAVTYLWWSMQRGKECGALALEGFSQPDGKPLPMPMPHPLPVGYQVGDLGY